MSGQAGVKHPQYRHGGRVGITSPEYSTWRSMRARCLNPKDRKYSRYGALGILVCAAWDDFSAFLADMGPRPSSQHTIDRIDPLGHYEPGNCRWADPKTQNRNRTNNKRVTFRGETLTVAEWAERLGVDQTMIGKRLRKGVPVEVALTQPSRQRKPLTAAAGGRREL